MPRADAKSVGDDALDGAEEESGFEVGVYNAAGLVAFGDVVFVEPLNVVEEGGLLVALLFVEVCEALFCYEGGGSFAVGVVGRWRVVAVKDSSEIAEHIVAHGNLAGEGVGSHEVLNHHGSLLARRVSGDVFAQAGEGY